jgi:ribosome-binding factor A
MERNTSFNKGVLWITEKFNALTVISIVSCRLQSSQKVGDTDIYGVSILEVKTSADISEAKVFVAIASDDEREKTRIFNALQSAAGFLRGEIARNMNLKNTPKIRFVLDKGGDNARRVEELLKVINEGK